MPLITYGTTTPANALWRAVRNTIVSATDLKRILNHMDTVKGAGSDWVAVATAYGCSPADATTGRAAYNAVNSAYANALNAHNAVLVFDKLQG